MFVVDEVGSVSELLKVIKIASEYKEACPVCEYKQICSRYRIGLISIWHSLLLCIDRLIYV